ncbi:MAG: type II/IV secretion system protein [Clostridia bacterium]|nr:type II/IV secretion system protein [Clostridia bacterium]
MAANRQPLGIELVRRGIVKEEDISRALQIQREHPGEKLGNILNSMNVTDSDRLLKAIGEILNEKTILLTYDDIKVKVDDYISMDSVRNNLAIPFEVGGGMVKVCFADVSNPSQIESVRLLLLNRGLVMDRYITYKSNIEAVINYIDNSGTGINLDSNVTTLVDDIIRQGMKRRASDIHIEPLEDSVRVRYRIDGIMVDVAKIDKEKQNQIVGRLKSISNMHQERQEPQDGRIILYPDYNIRSSSQKNIHGEKFVLRLLKKNQTIKGLMELGFPNDPKLINDAFNKRNSITIIAAPTGEGKTTTLYSAITFLNSPEINITTIEDPVEIRIPGLNQIEIDAKTSFAGSLRTVLRQDPNIILVGEIRDQETAEIAMQAGQTGHYVLSTIHTLNALEVITRLRKMNISDYDISSTVATTISQRLVRKLCPKCKRQRPFNDKEKEVIKKIGEKYNINFDVENHVTYDAVGCEECNNSGFFDRIALFEVLIFTDEIKDMVIRGESTLAIREQAFKQGYKPLVVEGIKRAVEGVTTMDELNNKLLFY